MSASQPWSRIIRMVIVPWPLSLLWFVLIALIGFLAPLAQIWATMRLVDLLAIHITGPMAEPGALTTLLLPFLPWVALLVGAWIAGWVVAFNILPPYLAALHAQRIVAYWSMRVYQKALALELAYFESPAYYEALQRARSGLNSEAIASQHSQFQRMLARAGGVISILLALASIDWVLALVLLFGSIAMLRWRLGQSRTLVAVQHTQAPLQRKQEYWRSLLLQRPPAAEVRMFGIAGYIIDQWQTLTGQLIAELAVIRGKHLRRDIAFSAGHTGLFSLVCAGLILAATQGTIGVGTLVAMLFATQQYLDLIDNFTRIDKLHQRLVELGYVQTFLEMGNDLASHRTITPERLLSTNGIRFEQVTFRYPGAEQNALDGIDLHIRPGERIALVGENGTGKSTLARVLLGLYQPTEGRITVGGVDLQSIAPEAWYNQTAAVFQEYMRYALSVRENIGFGRLERLHDDWAIAEAAGKSGADTLLELLPDGYATLLGKEFDGGIDLSGGQWQKLALARAYLRDAPLLVLDEPAAALDALAERAVYEQFLTLAEGKTVLLISHRLGSARMADRIVFLRQGRIEQIGTHAELLAAGGPYAELYRMQAGWYSTEAPDQDIALYA